MCYMITYGADIRIVATTSALGQQEQAEDMK